MIRHSDPALQFTPDEDAPMRQTWTFNTAGQITFGPGAAQQVGQVALKLKANRVLLVTDKNLRRAGLVAEICGHLQQAGVVVDVFDGGAPEPSIEIAQQCLEAALTFQPQGLVALGGGSNMDLAKACACVLTHGGTIRDYLGEERVPGPIMPLICLPTTSGTGSEVTGASVLLDIANHVKVAIISNALRPAAAIVDPKLTLSCPKKVTADSGIDALTHAIEAYTAIENSDFPVPVTEVASNQGRNPMGDLVAERAIELIGQNLVRVIEHPRDLAAREAMSLGAMLAGLAFSNVGVAIVHALEYPVGGAVHCSHGEGNGLLLPHCMRFNLPARVARLARIAQLLGEDISGLTEQQAAERSIAVVERVNQAIGIRPRLRDLGVSAGMIPTLAEKTFAIKRILRVNPRPVTLADLQQILEAAL